MRASFRAILAALLMLSLTGVLALCGCAPEEKESDPTEVETEAKDPDPSEKKDLIALQMVASRSLSGALDEVQKLYAKEQGEVIFESTRYLEPTSLIANLRASAYADILITDVRTLMDEAEEEELVGAGTREDIFSTDLVIVAKKGSGLTGVTLEDIAAGDYTVAVGDESTFVGTCAAQAFSAVGAYLDPAGETGANARGQGGEYVDIEPLIGEEVDDIRALVESGEADVALMYHSDAYRFDDVEVVGVIPSDTHKPIIYSGAGCTDSRYSEKAAEFLAWATTDPEALKVWKKWGFDLLA